MSALVQGKAFVFTVLQGIVGAQAVQGRAGRISREDREQALVDGRIEGDLRIREMGPDKVILHPVVLIDREMRSGVIFKGALMYELCRSGGDRIRLIDPVLLGVVQTAAHRERHVDGAGIQVRHHLVVTAVSGVCYLDIRDPQPLQDLLRQIPDHARGLSLAVGSTVGEIVVQVADMQGVMVLHPLPLRGGKSPGRDADGIIFFAQGIQVVRFLRPQKSLGQVQLFQKIRTFFRDTEIVIRSSEGAQHFRVLPALGAGALADDHFQLPGIKGPQQLLVALESNDLRLHMVLREILIQHADHGAFQHADLPSVQGGGIRRDLRNAVVLQQVVGFAAHDLIRVPHLIRPLLAVGKACQQVHVSVQEHLVDAAEISVNIFVLPAGIFGKLPVILVGIACFYCAFLCSLLEDFVVVISYADQFRFTVSGKRTHRKNACRQDQQAQEKHHSPDQVTGLSSIPECHSGRPPTLKYDI